MTETKCAPRVFLCYVPEDETEVRRLYTRLKNDGIDAWLDKEKLLPGQDWQLEITKTVKNSDAIIVCLSFQFVTKEGFVQKEIKLALDVAGEKPEGTIYFIPVRLDECTIPDSLHNYYSVDLFEDEGYEKIKRAIKTRFDLPEKESPTNPAQNIAVNSKSAQLTIIVEKDILKFTDKEKDGFVFAISKLTGVSPNQIRILRIAEGSVVITLEMPEVGAKRLMELFSQNDAELDRLKISKITFTRTEAINQPVNPASPVTKNFIDVLINALPKLGKFVPAEKKFATVEAQKIVIIGAIIVALIGLIGTAITAWVKYESSLMPIEATQTAEAKLAQTALAATSSNKYTPSATSSVTPLAITTPTETPTPVLICGPEVSVDDIPYIAPELAGGSPFGITAKKSCGVKRPDKAYSVELNAHSGLTSPSQWGIYSPGVVDLSKHGVVSFWLKGNTGGEKVIFGITDTKNRFAKYTISASSEWVNVIIPLSEFQNKGIDLHEVQNIFMDFEGAGDTTVYVNEITFVPMLAWDFRGVNLTAFSRDGYQSSEAKDLVDHFKQIGANYVSVLVTWYQDGQQATVIAPELNKTPSDESLKKIIDYINSQNMKVLLNLHVDDLHLERDYPGIDRWRGNFNPADSAQWFNSYREFATHYAQLAKVNQVEIINIGSEQASLEASQEDVSRWIDIIRAVRDEGYKGKLMYTMSRRGKADQQREGNLARLWKELDYVGTTVHFTLSEDITPSVENLTKAWNPYKDALVNWENTIQKPIIFTEVAYRSVDYCTKEPWRWRGTLGPQQIGNGEKCQQNAYEALLQAFGQESWLAGVFWWHYIPGSPSDYSPENKPADNIVNRWYGGLRTETILHSPIPPAPAEVTYDLEAPANMWGRPESSSLTTTSVASKKRPDTGNWVLEWMTSLVGKEENKRQGEVLLDLRYNQMSEDGSTRTKAPFSYNMLGKSVTCWVYVPEALSGLTIQLFSKSLGDSDENWRSEYGSPVPIKSNEWFSVTLKPDAISDTTGKVDSDDVDSGFDPKNVIAIGMKITASEDAKYNGPLFIDACSWNEH
jgi:hypothetical protein